VSVATVLLVSAPRCGTSAHNIMARNEWAMSCGRGTVELVPHKTTTRTLAQAGVAET
jgi:hypothetical protein